MQRERLCAVGIALAASVLVPACDAVDRSEPGVVRRDSSGITLVANDSPLWPDGTAWRIGEPVLAIGDPHTLEYYFPGLTGARRLDDGRIAVTDPASSLVRFYDREGRYLYAAGGSGAGEGRFRGVGRMWVARGDTVVVASTRDGRVHRFAADGTLVATTTLDPPAHVLRPIAIGQLADGTLIAWSMSVRRSAARAGTLLQDTLLFHAFAADGHYVRAVFRLPATHALRTPTAQGDVDVSIPFEGLASFAVGPDALVAGRANDASLYAVDGTGSVRWRSSWPAHAVPLSATDRDRALDSLRRRFDGIAGDAFAALPFPATSTEHDAVLVDDSGYIWVRHSASDPQHPLWSVLRSDGRWLGSLPMPAAFAPLHIGVDFILGVNRDADGVETVELRSLQREGVR